VPTTGRHPDREETYPIVYSVRDLGDCPSACPTSGDIDISFANGDIISWEFTGAAEVTVTGPRGYTLDVPLSCL
jgi:hypothetical protein